MMFYHLTHIHKRKRQGCGGLEAKRAERVVTAPTGSPTSLSDPQSEGAMQRPPQKVPRAVQPTQ